MSGTVIRLVEETKYDFTDLQAAANAEQFVTLAQHVDTSQWREAGLMVRVTSITLPGYGNDKIYIVAANDPWDPMSGTTLYDPQGTNAFIVNESLNPNESGSGAPPGGAYGMYFPLSNFGALITLSLLCTRNASSTPTDTIRVYVNVDLILKD